MELSKETIEYLKDHRENIENNDGEKFYSDFNALGIRVGEELNKFLMGKCNISFEEITKNMTTIPDWAFYGCENIKVINLSSVKEISYRAFGYCENLKIIDLPNVIKINSNAFDFCENLKSADLPNVTEINSEVFAGCTNLETVDLPKITVIGKSVFSGCSNLKKVTIPKNNFIGKTDLIKRLKEMNVEIEEI